MYPLYTSFLLSVFFILIYVSFLYISFTYTYLYISFIYVPHRYTYLLCVCVYIYVSFTDVYSLCFHISCIDIYPLCFHISCINIYPCVFISPLYTYIRKIHSSKHWLMIIQAEKSLNLLPATWRPKTGGRRMQHESGDPRTSRTNDIRCSLRAGEDPHPSLTSQTKKGKFSCSPLFCSIPTINRWSEAHPHWNGSSALLIGPFQRLISSGNPLTDTPRNKV